MPKKKKKEESAKEKDTGSKKVAAKKSTKSSTAKTKATSTKKPAAKKPAAKKSTSSAKKSTVAKKSTTAKSTDNKKKVSAKKAESNSTAETSAKKKPTAKKSISTTTKKETVKKAETSKTTTKKSEAKKPTTKKAVSKKKTSSKKSGTAKKADSKKPETKAEKTKVAKKDPNAVSTKQPKTLPDVRYSDDELDNFAKRIQEVREEAIDELRMLKERLDDLNAFDFAEESMIYSMHMAEQGSEALEKEKTYAQIQRINEYIKKLDDALQRIKEKTYGICRVCGCLIAKERLWAVPITTLSASYKIHQKCPEDGIDRIEPIKK